jgi:hypothetical protein
VRGWVRKDGPAVVTGPLGVKELGRLRAVANDDLKIWIENSLAKIGMLVMRKDAETAEFEAALTEAKALVQALEELTERG